MTVGQLVELLESHDEFSLRFLLPSGGFIPEHFHITEVGRVEKRFIDCGATRRHSVSCQLQLWTAHDVEHRLRAGKLAMILHAATPLLESVDLAVEIEYGSEVAAQYVLADAVIATDQLVFGLLGKQTDCLAKDKCGVGECGSNNCCR